MPTFVWVPLLVIHIVVSSYVSCMSNARGTLGWFLATALVGMLPMWALVSKYSHNVSADGLLYDSVVVLAYYPALLYFSGAAVSAPWYHWAGFVFVVFGITLTRL